MSVYRQLISLVSVIIMVTNLLWLAISLYTDRSIVIDNMRILARNGATSLAISMADIVIINDQSKLSILFDAVADLGPYRKLYFIDLDNTRLIERSFSTQAVDVPELFQRLVDLPTIEARAGVSEGWTKLGNVAVTIDPQLAYEKLWATLMTKLIWSLSITLSGMVASVVLIRSRLRAAQHRAR